MNVCSSCAALIGQSSEKPPHDHLQLTGSGVFGTPPQPITQYLSYRCDECGACLNRTTVSATPPERWTLAPGASAGNLTDKKSAPHQGADVL